jgi:hypothetical protein
MGMGMNVNRKIKTIPAHKTARRMKKIKMANRAFRIKRLLNRKGAGPAGSAQNSPGGPGGLIWAGRKFKGKTSLPTGFPGLRFYCR